MRKAIKVFLVLFLILTLLAAITAAVGYVMVEEYLDSHKKTYRFIGEDYQETTTALDNPYIGYFDIYGYKIRENRYVGMEASKHIQETDPSGRLVLLEMDLEEYANGPITEHGMSEIESLISMWTASGRDVMVRFLYDFAGKAQETEPKDIEIIKTHMSQCAELLNRYANDVYLTQSIFVGNIGEMHGSDYMTTAGMRELGEYYASVLDPHIFLSVRTPEQYRIITRRDVPVSKEEAFTDEISARIGLFNDGMLASDIDLGTYGDSHFTPTAEHEGKGDRAEEIAFQNELCRYVPSGGEVVYDNPFNDLMPAVDDLRNMHVSYIGRYHDESVKVKWKNSFYESAQYGDYLYEGMNGYDYIGRHLGYRYVVRDAYDTGRDIIAEKIGAAIDIENVGFSNAYRRFDISISLRGEDGTVIAIPTEGFDNRFWNSGEVSTLEYDIPFDQLTEQNYEIWLTVSDPVSGEMIMFANDKYSERDGILTGYISPDELSEEETKEILRNDIRTEGIKEVAKKVISEYVNNR